MDLRAILTDDGSALGGVPKHSMKDFVVQKIATFIATGILDVGDPLPSERELARALSVSRETVRGAILILSTKGILSVAQGTRTVVASTEVGELAVQSARYRDISRYSLDDVHEARLLIEDQVARAAAVRVEAATLETLQKSIEAQEAAIDDPVRFLICDREFHTAIYRAGGNAALADIAADLYSYLLDHRRRAVAQPSSIATSIADHRAILAGLEARDSEAAARAFAVHETRIYTTTKQLLTQSARKG
ncbi:MULTISPECIES: FCD domain-containing protein [unclassified Mesorhizobium]|uniref:FadR/GntR family transcriptional regulator n=1 Tax=unclassified Mesorhizobium TaxID=325217 RepID=UPI0011289006|nr:MULTISPECIES: FCD domain-containing protein [unclassified Mesorhizobium]TPJ53059.1 FadR family transcriptional regulator [Mesorhizobium sp. B2-6-4]TPM95925.1 FadR family transcriptional regulator [Mesorhizobium sp. B2-1-5]